MRLRLVDDWKRCWKWFSVHMVILLTAIPEVYDAFPALQDYLAPDLFRRLMLLLGVLTLIARVLKQS